MLYELKVKRIEKEIKIIVHPVLTTEFIPKMHKYFYMIFIILFHDMCFVV